MARRTARSSIPLEWKADTINTTDATVTNGEFDLDLLPDEIAEIWCIDSTIIGELASAAIDAVSYRMYLSMDPDANDSPAANSNLEDLEVFFSHQHLMEADYAEATETGGYAIQTVSNKIVKFAPFPVLVGTNFAQVVIGDGNEPGEFITRVYFKRRKANALELNQILLKRR